ncbi:hypothetical protein [Actinomadura parmotrematis]|uniref:DUF2637 domain-containing protein n=1 Tax=Actinomadura parmotrematis TaxID=2864039 RepID=A0ABS7FU18_9ACTN|nr:hypothetical protein [Actinomadura parmotrematis]MBW8483685.1 hypothetical protein [Actinomadura parmotrematis]
MSAGAGSDWTRPDISLPARPPAYPEPSPEAAPAPAPPADPAGAPGDWHRMHFPVGAFLTAFGVTALAVTALDWNAHRADMAVYVGQGAAAAGLAAVKLVQVLLLAATAMSLLRRRDVWFLPALAAWTAGYGVFAVLDAVKGRWLPLAEHLGYTAGFGVLLFVSYGLSVKARVASRKAAAPAAPEPEPQPEPEPAPAPAPAADATVMDAARKAPAPAPTVRDMPLPSKPPSSVPEPAGPEPLKLTRTQEFALNAVNRMRRGGR